MPSRLRSLASLLILTAACTPEPAVESPPQPAPTTTTSAAPTASAAPATDTAGIDLAGLDPSVKPGDDFFSYANGTWIKNNEIPADRSSWGTGAIVAERTAKRVADLIAEAAKSDAPAGSETRKVGDYYATFMDEATIEKKGLAPVKDALAAIDKIRDAAGLARALGATLRADVDVLNRGNVYTENLFGLWIAQDLSDPSHYSPFLLQGGLGMEDREYYRDASPRMAEIRTKYEAHLATLLKLAGVKDAEARAARVFALEKHIAEVHASLVDTNDVKKGNNHWTRKELEKRAPGLNWGEYLKAARLDKQKEFVVWQPDAIAGIAKLVKSEPLAVWKDYLTVHRLNALSAYLPKAFGEATFAFYGQVLQGTPQQRERWKRAVAVTDEALGEAVGKLYVAKYFPPSEKARAEAMVRNVIAAFGKRIDALEWMAPRTKAEAKAKLAALKVGIGYPDKWRDYSKLEVVRGDAVGNFLRSSMFDYESALARLGQPVDRGEWVMNPQLVNACNLPALNALNFPAAILQPPDFDPARPEVMDYGAVGAIIGHEICHSFDDSGALFDSKGKLTDWWTKDDYAHFRASSERLAKQFDTYEPYPGLHVNGAQTSSENIADVAGLAAAYDAYRLSLGGREAPTVAGLTGDQQFFISFAQAWRNKFREPALRRRIVTDTHAPPEYRSDTVRNLDAWYAAFDVKPGQKLHLDPKDRARVY
ncbi:MAG: M13 family metallopeptidase [Minicystis sp.]